MNKERYISKKSEDLFTLISDFIPTSEITNTCQTILLLMSNKNRNYTSLEELQQDYIEINLCNGNIASNFLIHFNKAVDYLLINKIIMEIEGFQFIEERVRLFLQVDSTDFPHEFS